MMLRIKMYWRSSLTEVQTNQTHILLKNNHRDINSIKLAHATLPKSLITSDKKDLAKKLLAKYDRGLLIVMSPYVYYL